MTTKTKTAAKKTAAKCPFACMECGYKFRTIAGAKKASFGVTGCPKCGGSDIDLGIDDEFFARSQDESKLGVILTQNPDTGWSCAFHHEVGGFKGTPVGRGMTKDSAKADLVRIANKENGTALFVTNLSVMHTVSDSLGIGKVPAYLQPEPTKRLTMIEPIVIKVPSESVQKAMLGKSIEFANTAPLGDVSTLPRAVQSFIKPRKPSKDAAVLAAARVEADEFSVELNSEECTRFLKNTKTVIGYVMGTSGTLEALRRMVTDRVVENWHGLAVIVKVPAGAAVAIRATKKATKKTAPVAVDTEF